MEVVAFVGPSGTGKSHRAIQVAQDNKCDGIVDDGILIKGSKILAGTTAKNEKNKIQAVKRAIFQDDQHAAQVREALGKSGITRLLVVGTSDHMVDNICQRLELPRPLETVYITDVATKLEIKQAKATRNQQGRHEVPVPSVELKPWYDGYFADLSKNIRSLEKTLGGGDRNSIVRPDFSFYGKLLIADKAINDIVDIVVKKYGDVHEITDFRVKRRSVGTKDIGIFVEITVYYGARVEELSRTLVEQIQTHVETMTGMQVQVEVPVGKLVLRQKEEKCEK